MITNLNVTTIYVLDKDEALDFYVDKLGLEKGNDVRQGDYRWLTVRVPGETGTEISLEQPGPPMHDDATAERLSDPRRRLGRRAANGEEIRAARRCGHATASSGTAPVETVSASRAAAAIAAPARSLRSRC